jgi:hypothetical protein
LAESETAGTVTIALEEPELEKHYGSGSGFGPESNINLKKNSKQK